MSAIAIAGAVLLVFLISVILLRWQERRARRWYRGIEKIRVTAYIIGSILLIATFIQSGNPLLVLAAFALALLAGLYVAVEQPHKEVR